MAAQQGAGNAAVSRALAARRVLARSQDPETEADPEFRELYEAKLREGIGLLEGVAFGRAEGSHVMADNGDRYDARNWAVRASTGKGADDAMLVLRQGVLPSKAIDDLFADLGAWSLDCAQYVQVAEFYALRHARGAEAFDAANAGMRFEFRPLRSTGLTDSRLYTRTSPAEKMVLQGDRPEAAFADDVVAAAPIGSRVGWRNLAAPASSAFYNENTVKLGPDQFAAHGFGAQTIFTRQQLMLALAGVALGREADPVKDFDYIAENVFIVEVEVFRIY